MAFNTTNRLRFALALLAAIACAGCPSSRRIVVEGYDDAMLSGKRVMVILPEAADVTLTDPNAYASARGVAGESAREQLSADLRSRFVDAIDARLDSNTVLGYRDQPVGAMVPLDATKDFTAAGPKAWDVVKRAGREGNIDYLIVLNGMTIRSTPSSTGRGGEAINANYLLLDAQQGKTMTAGTVSVNVAQLQGPNDGYLQLARELSAKLPFVPVAGE